jgi:hypothetical protein
MDDAEIERILRAIRTPLGISASGAPSGMRRGVNPGRSAAERRAEAGAVERREAGRVTRANDAGWMPEAEARRLRKAIRISFCNSPHKRKYWTALLDMYAGPDAGKRARRHWAASAAKPAGGNARSRVGGTALSLEPPAIATYRRKLCHALPARAREEDSDAK